jgi:3-hydroxyisobutyrate dehydrogenase-like beta-hydroxyacid dehydrogenase
LHDRDEDTDIVRFHSCDHRTSILSESRCFCLKFCRYFARRQHWQELRMADIAVLGTGAMGARIAVNLIKAGHRVAVWNRTADKAMLLREFGARVAQNPRAAIGGAEFVVAMVRDDEASRAVWLDPATGALAAMRHGGVAIECSTLSLGHVRHLAECCASGGVGFLDAPVVGSRPQAEAARLVYLIGGNEATLARTRPVLSAAGDALHHVGPAGSGTILKLAINALFGIQVAGAAELFGLLHRAAIDLPAAIRIIGSLPSCSIAAKAALEAMLSESFAPLFPAELARKDLDYAIALSGDPANLPVTAAGREVFAKAVQHNYGADNLTGIVRLYTHR